MRVKQTVFVERVIEISFVEGRFPRPFISRGRRLSVGGFECRMFRMMEKDWSSKVDRLLERNGMFQPHVPEVEIWRGSQKIGVLHD